LHLTLHLTTACNLRCGYCYAPPRAGPRMSEETAAKALDLGARLSEGSCGVIFFGGEPLLERDLIRATVDRARALERRTKARFHFKITTNGVLLDQEFLALAEREGILVALSVDGIREAHDRHRRFADGRPSFDIVQARLRMLLAARPYSSVILVVNPDTVPFLSESVSYLLDEGCRYLIVSLNYAGDWSERSLRALERQYRKLGRSYVRWTRAGRKFYLSPFEVKLASHIDGCRYRRDRCELAKRQISVDPEGFLFPCVQFPAAGSQSEWCIGHVERGLDEKARARVRRAVDAEQEECRSCALRDRCNHTCGCLNWQTTGSVDRVSGVLCRHERMLMPIADRVGKILYRRRDPLFLHKQYNAAYPVLSLLEDAAARRS